MHPARAEAALGGPGRPRGRRPGSFELGVLAAAPPTLTGAHACLRSDAPPGPRARRADAGTALSPPGLSGGRVAVSRGEALGSQDDPGPATPARSQTPPRPGVLDANNKPGVPPLDRAAPAQVDASAEPRARPPAPPPAPPPGGRGSEPRVWPGRHLRAPRGSGAAADSLSRPEPAPPATCHRDPAPPVPFRSRNADCLATRTFKRCYEKF